MTKEEQKRLSGLAHKLKPVVMIGQSGLSDAVVNEIELALTHHELLKIKILEDDRSIRSAIGEQICSKCSAELVQSIGKILVIYRKNPDSN